MKGPVQSVEASYLVHATEDPLKLEQALGRLLGISSVPEPERLLGHFGNEILKVRVHLTGEDARRGFVKLASAIPEGVRAEVLANIATHLDEHSSLFIRFDKQSLVSGSVALGWGDAVRVKVKPRIFLVRGGAAKFYSSLMGGR